MVRVASLPLFLWHPLLILSSSLADVCSNTQVKILIYTECKLTSLEVALTCLGSELKTEASKMQAMLRSSAWNTAFPPPAPFGTVCSEPPWLCTCSHTWRHICSVFSKSLSFPPFSSIFLTDTLNSISWRRESNSLVFGDDGKKHENRQSWPLVKDVLT